MADHALEVRLARRADAIALQEIERAAGEQFRSVGLTSIADDEPFAIDELNEYIDAGRCWLALELPLDGDGSPIGYLVVDIVDGCAHVEQVSVVPEHQGRGAGRALMEAAVAWASEQRLPGVTLTTYAEVSWNRPLYEHLGYRVLGDGEVGPELRALRVDEREHGLDISPRVCMRLDLV